MSDLVLSQKRFTAEVQYVLNVAADGVPGHRETWPAWRAYKGMRSCGSTRDFSVLDGDARHNFTKDVQAFLGVDPTGIPTVATWSAWCRHAYADVIAAAVYPIPVWRGARPTMSSGFNNYRGWGPNMWRKVHLGVDLEYKWSGKGDPPQEWRDHHFQNRADRLYYCPPVPVYAVLPGTVVGAYLVDYDSTTGSDDRYVCKIDHGEWPGLGHVLSWSTHHRELHVEVGDAVQADTQIATAGDMGAIGAPHDHHELWRYHPGEDLWPRAKQLGVSVHQLAAFDPVPLFREFRQLEAG